jgi:hypothetical protein
LPFQFGGVASQIVPFQIQLKSASSFSAVTCVVHNNISTPYFPTKRYLNPVFVQPFRIQTCCQTHKSHLQSLHNIHYLTKSSFTLYLYLRLDVIVIILFALLHHIPEGGCQET